jgi:tetratricopeptide (TPR) repeat protein
MFPKLTPLQWIVFILGLFFYGFAVFAVTRDYYIRNPPRPVRAPLGQQGEQQGAQQGGTMDMQALRQSMRDALAGDAGAVPAEALLGSADKALLAREADRLFAARRFQAAVPLYRRILELDPGAIDARNDLGLALHYAGDTATGLATLREGAAAAPRTQRIQLSLGFVALQAGAVDTARGALERARELDPASDIGREAARLLALLDERDDDRGR